MMKGCVIYLNESAMNLCNKQHLYVKIVAIKYKYQFLLRT